MVNSIVAQLNEIGIPCTVGQGTDITVDTELLDAQWSTGQKRIEYHAAAFLNEAESIMYFWEFTKETSSGFSFGGDSESSFQSGMTLFRKVKSIQYGPDGKAYEYSLDLGAITKAFKGTAKQAGWKFNVVLNKNKALYPTGYQQSVNQNIYYPPNPTQNTFENATYSAPPSKTGTLGLIGLISLAVITMGLLALMEASVAGWILSALVLSGLYLLNKRLSSKGCLTALGLWVVTAIILFMILVFTTPDSDSPSGNNSPAKPRYMITLTKELEKEITASSNDTIISYRNYKIYIPGGTVKKTEDLVISKAAGTPKVIEGLTELCAPFDVKLGSLTNFKQPIIIEIPYDKTKLAGLNPQDAFIAVYYDEKTGQWRDVPYQADPNLNVVRLQMYHLTTVSCYYSMWEGARVYDNGSALVIFNLSDDSRKYFAQYEEAAGKTTADPTKPQMVVDAAELARKIIKAYQDAGLNMTGKPKIYLTTKNNYDSSSGNLTLKMDFSANDRNQDKLLARNLGHELFHKAQHNTLGWFAYSKTSYANASWWMEATADYMGNNGVWLLLGEPPIKKYEEIPMLFFDRELYFVGDGHEYEAANFVDFVMSKHKATPLELIQLAEESSILSSLNFETRFNRIFRDKQYTNLLSYYDGFVEYTFFDKSSKYALKNNKQMEPVFKKFTELEFEPDANNKAKNPVLEGDGEIEVPDSYTAGFYRFTSDMDTTLEITSDSPLIMHSVNRTRGDRGFTRRVNVSSGTPATINFSKDDYIVMIATGTTRKTCDFKYKAAPMAISAKQVSGIVPIKIRFPNGVIPAFDAENKGLQVSITKWAQDEKYNLSFYNQGCFYADSKMDYEISNFNIVNPTQFLLQGDSNGGLYVEGEAEIEFTYWPNVGSRKTEVQTVPVKATLTPNSEGYDIRLDINGMISEGKLK